MFARLLPHPSGRAGVTARRFGAAVRRRDPRTLSLSALVISLVLEVIGFAHLVEDYLTGDPIVRWDVRLAAWLHEHASHPLVRVFEVVTYGGNAVVLGVAVLATAFFVLRSGRTNDAALLVIAFGGAVVVNGALKLLFHRPRPELAFVHLDTYSFPSGHAAASAATFTAAAWLIGRRRTTSKRVLVAIAAAAAICVVGFSRLYLGAHYLSDVLAGITFGVGWATLCLIGYVMLAERDILSLLRRRG